MSPVQAAKERCAKYDNGACLGIYYNDDLSIDRSRYRPLARCLVSESDQGCPDFEECALGLRISRETLALAKRADALASAIWQYRVTTATEPSRSIKRICRECGRPDLEPGKRLCAMCGKMRVKESKRRYQQKWRSKSALRWFVLRHLRVWLREAGMSGHAPMNFHQSNCRKCERGPRYQTASDCVLAGTSR
jgi:ribosomal protein L37E